MALNNVQERVERSIFLAINKVLVDEGYIPDVANYQPESDANQLAYDAAVDAIVAAKTFAAEAFGHSVSLAKGNQRVPRIVITPRRIMPGDIGTWINPLYSRDPLNPDAIVKTKPPYKSTNLHIDISTVSGTAAQDRVLNAVLAKALGNGMGYVKVFDSDTETFFIRQFNHYDLPDNEKGIEKRVYSYEVPDLYLTDGEITSNVPFIKEITVETTILELQSLFTRDGIIIGPYTADGKIFIDLSGIHFQN